MNRITAHRLHQKLLLPFALVASLGACGQSPEPVPRVTWESFASGFMQDHCVRCHQGDHSGGDYTVYAEVVADADVMRCGVALTELDGCEDPMPAPRTFPTGPRPPDEEVEMLVEWLDSGAPRE